MGQKKLTQAIRTILASSLGLSVGLASTFTFADDAKPAKVQKITVTGSLIKGVAAQSASPITVVKTEELAKQGVTTTEQALAVISANQSSFVAAQNVGRSATSGSSADLRGLGANKTLVLLNGRRVANTPFDTSSVDLNTIPLALVDRIEVLKDGASATYGTDAIGGVINFITKKEYTGAGVSVEGSIPEASSGENQQYSLFGGYGHLDDEGFNVYGALNYSKQDGIMASERSFSQRGGVIPELGVNVTSGGAFPANIAGVGNPYAATGCGNNPLNKVSSDGKSCRFNPLARVGIVPEQENWSFLGKGTLKLTDNMNAIAEYMHSESRLTSIVAPDVMLSNDVDHPENNYKINSTSPYYPGNGITPALAGVDPNQSYVNLRSQAGNRVSENVSKADRFLVGLDGSIGEWDINTGLSYAKSTGEDNLQSGYINNALVRQHLEDGTLNPFGPSANADIWNGMTVTGVSQKADLESTNFDFTASRSLFTLPAGDVGFAVGTSFRHDKWSSSQNPDITSLVSGLGVDPTQAPNSASRNLKALYTEFQVPILKSLNLQFSGRYDDYSDFGSTFNPKVAFRWEPIPQLMFRGSYSTGFRAPSLNEMNGSNFITNTSQTWDDPKLCPGGVAAAGKDASTVCDAQQKTRTGGNKDLKAEKSTSYNFGTVFEPVKNLVFTVDYFNIEVKNQISYLTESAIFGDPAKYADKYIRNANGDLSYIDQSLQNLGGTKTSGVDYGVQWRSAMTQYGRLGFSFDGTYINSYKFQTEQGGEWKSAVGRYDSDFGSVITRWKHNLNVNWNYGPWNINAQQTFFKGYLDQNNEGQNHRVSDYKIYNLAGTYTGFKNLELTLGIRNLFDTKPPASNVEDNNQMGYDPRYSDPMGRAYYGRATYKF